MADSIGNIAQLLEQLDLYKASILSGNFLKRLEGG